MAKEMIIGKNPMSIVSLILVVSVLIGVCTIVMSSVFSSVETLSINVYTEDFETPDIEYSHPSDSWYDYGVNRWNSTVNTNYSKGGSQSLYIHNVSRAIAGYFNATYFNLTDDEYGYVELWFLTTGNHNGCNISIYSDGGRVCRWDINKSFIRLRNEDPNSNSSCYSISDATWYKIKMVFNYNNNTVLGYVYNSNNNQVDSGYVRFNTTSATDYTSIDQIIVSSHSKIDGNTRHSTHLYMDNLKVQSGVDPAYADYKSVALSSIGLITILLIVLGAIGILAVVMYLKIFG